MTDNGTEPEAAEVLPPELVNEVPIAESVRTYVGVDDIRWYVAFTIFSVIYITVVAVVTIAFTV